MILNDEDIRSRCEQGMVAPYRPANVQPASIDVSLGTEFKVFVPHAEGVVDLRAPVDITKHVKIPEDNCFVLHPGEFVLGVTEEAISMPDDLVGRVEGKSSLGRLGLIVHATAGFIDPGFRGPITLEMTNLMRLPLVLRPGKLIAQISFYLLTRPAEKPYNGRYQNAKTVESSRYGSPKERNASDTVDRGTGGAVPVAPLPGGPDEPY